MEPYTEAIDIRAVISEKENIPMQYVTLMLRGVELQDHTTMTQCGVTRNTTLGVILHLQGGGAWKRYFEEGAKRCPTKSSLLQYLDDEDDAHHFRGVDYYHGVEFLPDTDPAARSSCSALDLKLFRLALQRS